MNKNILSIIAFLLLIPFISASQHYPGDYISKFAYNSTGGEQAIVNCASFTDAKCIFYIKPPANEVWEIHRMIFSIGDTGLLSGDDYGAISNGLTNGIVIIAYDDGVKINLTNSMPIKSNHEWGNFVYDLNLIDWGSGPDFIQGDWAFDDSGSVLRLNGSTNDNISIFIRDDLSGLHSHSFLVQGHIWDDTSDVQLVRSVTMQEWMILVIIGLIILAVGEYIRNWAVIISSGVWFLGVAATAVLGLMTLGFSMTLFFMLFGVLITLHGVSNFFDREQPKTVRDYE